MEQTVLKPKNLPKELLTLHAVSISLAGIRRRPPTMSTQRLPIIAIGPRDISSEAKSIRDLEALADVGLVVPFGSPPESPQSNSMSLLADSVDHGSNREPRGAVPSQTEPCATPTVRFAPRTALPRHGSVYGGREPPWFATVRHSSQYLRSPPRFFMVRDIFSRGFHTHRNI